MRSTIEIHVDDERYMVTKYSGTKGTELFVKLIKAVGDPLSHLVDGASGGLDSEFNISSFGSALRSFAMSADPKEFTGLMKEILSTTMVVSDSGNRSVQSTYDADFSGRIGHLFKLVIEVVKFQYADFLDVVVGITSELPTKAVQKVKAL